MKPANLITVEPFLGFPITFKPENSTFQATVSGEVITKPSRDALVRVLSKTTSEQRKGDVLIGATCTWKDQPRVWNAALGEWKRVHGQPEAWRLGRLVGRTVDVKTVGLSWMRVHFLVEVEEGKPPLSLHTNYTLLLATREDVQRLNKAESLKHAAETELNTISKQLPKAAGATAEQAAPFKGRRKARKS